MNYSERDACSPTSGFLAPHTPCILRAPEQIRRPESRAGEAMLPGVISPELPAGATQVVSGPSDDLGKAHGILQLQPIPPAAGLPS